MEGFVWQTMGPTLPQPPDGSFCRLILLGQILPLQTEIVQFLPLLRIALPLVGVVFDQPLKFVHEV